MWKLRYLDQVQGQGHMSALSNYSVVLINADIGYNIHFACEVVLNENQLC